MERAEQLTRPISWRTATAVATAVALAELAALLALTGVRLVPHLHGTRAPAAPTRPERTRPVSDTGRVPKGQVAPAPAGVLHPRARLSVLVLNGNGVAGVAGREAARLRALGYGSTSSANAASSDYARSLVLFAPGHERDATRLARDAGIRAVSPLDGLKRSQLRGSQLVVILGGS